jgi:1-acyl-sn-glycerol-3-phosphate acyltransferase
MRNASPARESSPSADAGSTDAVAALTPGRLLYGLYAWLQFLLLALLTLGLLLVVPTLRARRQLTRGTARLALALAGMRVQIRGLETLPMPSVAVANHVSYLDGVMLHAVLPIPFSFVIKREMSSVPLAGLLLRRLGAEFVDRRGRAHGLADARRLLRQASSGQALVFFPEGTFGPSEGLGHFHIGAFAAAERARLPVVPIAIRGTRHCLPSHSLWPRPGRIEVQVLAALTPPEGLRSQRNSTELETPADRTERAAQLRDQAHAVLAAALEAPVGAPA